MDFPGSTHALQDTPVIPEFQSTVKINVKASWETTFKQPKSQPLIISMINGSYPTCGPSCSTTPPKSFGYPKWPAPRQKPCVTWRFLPLCIAMHRVGSAKKGLVAMAQCKAQKPFQQLYICVYIYMLPVVIIYFTWAMPFAVRPSGETFAGLACSSLPSQTYISTSSSETFVFKSGREIVWRSMQLTTMAKHQRRDPICFFGRIVWHNMQCTAIKRVPCSFVQSYFYLAQYAVHCSPTNVFKNNFQPGAKLPFENLHSLREFKPKFKSNFWTSHAVHCNLWIRAQCILDWQSVCSIFYANPGAKQTHKCQGC